jgi:hypothetical protein
MKNCFYKFSKTHPLKGVGTTEYELKGWGSKSGMGKIFVFSTASKPALEPTQPYDQWVPETISPGVKRPGREADHSPPSSAKVKNAGAIPPLLIYLHGIVLD